MKALQAVVALCAAAGLAACGPEKTAQPNIPFAPYDKSYASKPDLAQVDHAFPIPTAEIARITPDYLATLDQEQLDQLKHLWAKYGNAITWLLILVLGGFAAWNGWQYWQRKTAVAAAALYDELDRAVQAQQPERVQRVWADLQDSAARSAQAAQGGLLAAKALYTAGKPDEARAALTEAQGAGRTAVLVAADGVVVGVKRAVRSGRRALRV